MPNYSEASDSSEMSQNVAGCHSEKNAEIYGDPIPRKKRHLSQRQFSAIPLLLHGLSDVQVAARLNIDRRTILRWRNGRKFSAELEKQRQQLIQQSITRLQGLLDPALDILQKQITGDDPKTALRAAAILLRIASPARLARMSEPAEPEPAREQVDPFDRLLEQYMNAPMPFEPGYDPQKMCALKLALAGGNEQAAGEAPG